jgi:hypothetical protein
VILTHPKTAHFLIILLQDHQHQVRLPILPPQRMQVLAVDLQAMNDGINVREMDKGLNAQNVGNGIMDIHVMKIVPLGENGEMMDYFATILNIGYPIQKNRAKRIANGVKTIQHSQWVRALRGLALRILCSEFDISMNVNKVSASQSPLW